MKKEMYIYETQKRDYGRKVYKIRRKAKEVVCWECGYKWLIRKDRRSPMYCRECANKGERSYFYKRAPKKKGDINFDQKEYTRNYSNQIRWDKKKEIVEHMGNKCWKCGAENLPICVWQWHHVNPSEKKHIMSQILTKSYEKILEESNKCVLVCSNCHKIIHYGEEKLKN